MVLPFTFFWDRSQQAKSPKQELYRNKRFKELGRAIDKVNRAFAPKTLDASKLLNNDDNRLVDPLITLESSIRNLRGVHERANGLLNCIIHLEEPIALEALNKRLYLFEEGPLDTIKFSDIDWHKLNKMSEATEEDPEKTAFESIYVRLKDAQKNVNQPNR